MTYSETAAMEKLVRSLELGDIPDIDGLQWHPNYGYIKRLVTMVKEGKTSKDEAARLLHNATKM